MTRNILIFSAAVLILFSISILAKQLVQSIDVNQAKAMIDQNTPNLVILDIRTPEEFNREHIKGAINIDYYANNFETELNKLDKSKTYIMYCRSGNRSRNAMRTFQKLGFQKVYNVLGGISSWTSKGYKVVK